MKPQLWDVNKCSVNAHVSQISSILHRFRFTQNLSMFRRDVNDSLKAPTNMSNSISLQNDMMSQCCPAAFWQILSMKLHCCGFISVSCKLQLLVDNKVHGRSPAQIVQRAEDSQSPMVHCSITQETTAAFCVVICRELKHLCSGQTQICR